ncbi:glucose-1-phosphate cytidylyltransferase [Silvimonas sp. JCM 19000]
MKVVILAGGLGTRLGEETDLRPKPMVEIGGRPILWHIMKSYSNYGFHEFVILLGYKGNQIKEFFANYFLYQGDVTIDLTDNQITVHRNQSEPWKVTLLETGRDTMTGGRILRARDYLGDEDFMLTYGDGVSDIDLDALLAQHQANPQTLVTMSTVQPEARFGIVGSDDAGMIREFREKPAGDLGWINAGFMVCRPGVFDYIEGDSTVFEAAPLETLATSGHLMAYRHTGFWKCMDTLRDKLQLNQLWAEKQAPWKTWE